MITPPSNHNNIPPLPPPGQRGAPAEPRPAADRISLGQTKKLEAALARTPEIRPEVVARGRELAVDPKYPPLAIVNHIASTITGSVDPSLIED